MELETLFGLPAHPLIVHGAVVLLPLAAAATMVAAVVPRARRLFGPLALGLSIVGLGAVGLAQGSGEALEHQVKETALVEAHTEMGESVLPWAIGLVVVSAGVAGVDTIRKRVPAVPAKVITVGLPVAAAVAVLGATVSVIRVGHSGAEAVWSGTTSAATADHD